jgi:hypothetical protein
MLLGKENAVSKYRVQVDVETEDFAKQIADLILEGTGWTEPEVLIIPLEDDDGQG